MYQYAQEDMSTIFKYLTMMKLATDSAAIKISENVYVCQCAIPGHEQRFLKVVFLTDIARLMPCDDINTLAILYVAADYIHMKELLIYNRLTVAQLMYSSIIVTHITGAKVSLCSKVRFVAHWIVKSESYIKDRDVIYDLCGLYSPSASHSSSLTSSPDIDKEHKYMIDSTSSQHNTSRDIRKTISLFNIRLGDILETFGVDYIYIVYRHYILTRLSIDATLYTIQNHESIIIAYTDERSDYGKINTD